MNVKIKVYDDCKYVAGSKKVAEIIYRNIKDYKVVTGNKATEIGNTTDEANRDEYNEYLVITVNDEETAIFCNSHVDMFIEYQVI